MGLYMHDGHSRYRAFTLVEMSIVLVIVGLLVGGVAIGTSVLRNSEMQTVISDYTKYANAFNQFIVQYGSPPGDLKDATSYWGDNATVCADATITNGSPGTCNGDGNSIITDIGAEPNMAWTHLQLAKLIAGNNFITATIVNPPASGTTVPAGRLTGSGWVLFNNSAFVGTGMWYNQDLGNLLSIGRPVSIGTNLYVGGNPVMTATEAWQIDAKIDDGKPATGRILTLNPTGSGTPVPNCATTSVDATAAYNVTYSDKACSLMMSTTTK